MGLRGPLQSAPAISSVFKFEEGEVEYRRGVERECWETEGGNVSRISLTGILKVSQTAFFFHLIGQNCQFLSAGEAGKVTLSSG